MNDILSKVIGILLAFALLVAAPLTITRMAEDMAMRRQSLSEVQRFIDIATDKGSVTREDVDDLYLAINAYGASFDTAITLYRRISYPDSSAPGGVRSLYIAADEHFGEVAVTLRSGEILSVTVNALERSSAQKLLDTLLWVHEPGFSFSLAGMVR